MDFILIKMGPPATYVDAEKLWIDFYDKKLDNRIKKFDPNRKKFWDYLIYRDEKNWDSLENQCFKRGDNIRKNRDKRPIPLTYSKGDQLIELEIEDNSEDNDPENHLIQEEEYKNLKQHLQECINQLPEKRREVIIIYYFEERPIADISKCLGKTETNVKAILCRARKQLAELFLKKIILMKKSITAISEEFGIAEATLKNFCREPRSDLLYY